MPDIDLLKPQVLLGVIEKFKAPTTHVMLNRVNKRPSPFPFAVWDVLKGSRALARPNVPNSEAYIVPRLGRSQMAAQFIYLREKKVFDATTMRWLREPGSLNRTNAEAAILREYQDLNARFDNFAELILWRALTGTLLLDYTGVVAPIDYQMPSSHKVTPGVSWNNATPENIIADIRAWKDLVERNGGVEATEALATNKTIERIFSAFVETENSSLLSDRMKDEYYRSGKLQGFMGLDWTIAKAAYDSTGSGYSANGPQLPAADTKFLPDDTVIMGNFTENNPIELMVGPTADLGAPAGFTGKFAKTWQEQDPSGLQYLLEWSIMPVVTRPEQWVYVSNVAPDADDPDGRSWAGRSWS